MQDQTKLTTHDQIKEAWQAAQEYSAFMLRNGEPITPNEYMAYQSGYLKCLRKFQTKTPTSHERI